LRGVTVSEATPMTLADEPVSRAAVYTRISRDFTGAVAGVARQEQDCREKAASLGWEVAEVFSDNDTSAYSGKRRPRYEAMLG